MPGTVCSVCGLSQQRDSCSLAITVGDWPLVPQAVVIVCYFWHFTQVEQNSSPVDQQNSPGVGTFVRACFVGSKGNEVPPPALLSRSEVGRGVAKRGLLESGCRGTVQNLISLIRAGGFA